MGYSTTRESRTRLTPAVSEVKVGDINYLMQLTEELEDKVGLDGDTADPNGTIVAQVKDLQDQLVASSFPTGEASATHGPVSLVITDSAGHTMAAAPSAGLAVYVTSIAAWNEDTTASRLSASDGTIRFRARLAATDGTGFVHAFDPPWELPESTALTITMDVPITSALVTVNFYTDVPTV